MKYITIVAAFFICIQGHIQAQWVQTNGPSAGWALDFESVGSQIWAGTKGGIYITVDNAENWSLAPFTSSQTTVFDIYTASDTIMYIGAEIKEGYNYDALFIRLSLDGGVTWTESQITNLADKYITTPDYYKTHFIKKVANRLYVGLKDRLYFSENLGINWIRLNIPVFASMNSVQVSESGIIVAGSKPNFDHGIIRSFDGGQSWTPFDIQHSLGEIYVENSLILATNPGYTKWYRSADFGANWEEYIAPGGYSSVLEIRRGTDGNLYVNEFDNFYSSSDNGKTWSSIPNTPGTNTFDLGTDIFAGDDLFLISSNIGIVKSQNYLAAPFVLSNQGFYAAEENYIKTNGKSRVYSRSSQLYYYSDDDGLIWNKFIFPDSLDGNQIYMNLRQYMDFMHVHGDTILAGLPYQNYFIRSIDNGVNWEMMQLPESFKFNYFLNKRKSVFLQHNNRTFVYTSDKKILMSTDMGTTWTIINESSTLITDVLQVGQTVFSLRANGQIFTSTNNGTTWQLVYLPATYTPGIHLLLHGNRVFAIAKDYQLYSDDLGNTWTPCNLPINNSGSMTGIEKIINNDSILYVATEQEGIFKSIDNGSSWNNITYNLGNLLASDLHYGNGKLYLGTTVNGVWKLDSTGSVTIPSEPKDFSFSHQSLKIYPNPTSDQIGFCWTDNKTIDVIAGINIYNQQGQLVFAQKELRISNSQRIDLRRFPTGMYIVEMIVGKERYCQNVEFVR